MNLLPVAQPIPAQPPAHGLLASATEATDLPFEKQDGNGEDRWGLGFVVQPENCVAAEAWDPDCEVWPTDGGDNPLGDKTFKSTPPTNEASYNVSPVVIELPFECGTHGFLKADYQGRAVRQLNAATSKAMEYELATGALRSTNPNLQTGATVLESGSVFEPMDALALLSQALSNCGHGGKGMIHAPTMYVDKLLEAGGGNVKEVGNRLVTVNRGDTIVSGTGYPGLGPGGAAPADGVVYVYATTQVQYRMSDVMVWPDSFAEALDRAHNSVEYRAERAVAMNFDPCCHFVVQARVWTALA